jgi:hypothetical protein
MLWHITNCGDQEKFDIFERKDRRRRNHIGRIEEIISSSKSWNSLQMGDYMEGRADIIIPVSYSKCFMKSLDLIISR